MLARPITENDLAERGTEIHQWMQDVADESFEEMSKNIIIGALQKGTHTIWAWCQEDQTMQGIIITTIVQFGDKKIFSVVGAAGNAENYKHLDAIFNGMAKAFGCQRYEIKGRRGFVKAFKPFGWSEKYVVCGRDVYDSEEIK